MHLRPGLLADGLLAWSRGDFDSVEAQAAAYRVARMIQNLSPKGG